MKNFSNYTDYSTKEELHFESKEVEEYYRKERRILGIGHPCRWDSQEVITKEDVDNYIKDAKNILSC